MQIRRYLWHLGLLIVDISDAVYTRSIAPMFLRKIKFKEYSKSIE